MINVTGTVSGDYNGNPYSETDYCVYPNMVREYYCNSTLAGYSDMGCVSNCSIGRCI